MERERDRVHGQQMSFQKKTRRAFQTAPGPTVNTFIFNLFNSFVFNYLCFFFFLTTSHNEA